MVTLSLRIDDEIKQKLIDYAADNDLSVSQVVRKILKDFFDSQKTK